jgi:hypothetical protein
MLRHTEDHPICVAVHEAIVSSENSNLSTEEREFALDCIEDALAHSTAVLLEEARTRLIGDAVKGLTVRFVTQEESAWMTMLETESQKPLKPSQRSCSGCGWNIVDLPGKNTLVMGEPRQSYCVACDPKGNREVVAAEALLFESKGF